MKLPFHKAYGNLSQNGGVNGINMNHQLQFPSGLISRELIERAAALEDGRDSDTPKLLRDLRCAYELILDHKHTRLRVMEVARAIKEAASATPPAFSPGGSRGTTPGGSSGVHYGSHRYPNSGGNSYDGRNFSSNISYSSHSQSPTAALSTQAQQARLAEEATSRLMQPGIGRAPTQQSQYSSPGHSVQHTPPNSVSVGGSHPVVQMTSSIPGNTGMIAQHQHGRRTRRWYLGIQSKKDPAHVMNEVYKALMALGCEWLQLSSYRIKCKWRPNVPKPGQGLSAIPFAMPSAGGETPQAAWAQNVGTKIPTDVAMDVEIDNNDKRQYPSGNGLMTVISPKEGQYVRVPHLATPEYSIKIGLTLYKVQQNIYLLDFQKMTGDAFSFMTLCANIITELKTLSAASRQAQQALYMAQQQQQQQQLQGNPGGGR
jgi:hypothetical protein